MKCRRILTSLISMLFLFTLASNAQYKQIFRFENFGQSPNGPLVSDGISLFGMTAMDGNMAKGVIFKCKIDGTGFVKLLDFDNTTGGYPDGSLILIENFLYGMTTNGGVYNFGTIFKIKTDGTEFTKLFDFSGANGRSGSGALYYDGTFLYGMTREGGTNGLGVIFKLKPDGTEFVKILDFSRVNTGAGANGPLIYDGEFFYGVTSQGGVNDMGTIFQIKSDGTGFKKLLDFDGTTKGRLPTGSLVSDGISLFGNTIGGGSNDAGVIFKIKKDGTGFVKLRDFALFDSPRGSLVYDGAFLFGRISTGIFKIKPDGTGYTTIFDSLTSTNSSSLLLNGTSLYGITPNDGNVGFGIIFKINTDGKSFSKLHDFSGYLNGNYPGSIISVATYLYGITNQGGINNAGVVFKVKPDGTEFSKLFDFDNVAGFPKGSLFSVGSYLYGETTMGGANGHGTIYKIRQDGTGFVKLLDKDSISGYSEGSLITDGTYIFGVDPYAGANNKGAIFRMKLDGTGYSKLFSFNNTSVGERCNPGLFSDGTFLYGTTYYGGTNNKGTVFKIKKDGTGFTKLLDFSGTSNGAYPQKNAFVSDGQFLYGLTIQGGTANTGVLYRIKPDGTGYSKLLDFPSGQTGFNPQSLCYDGTFLYGFTAEASSLGNGAVFKIKPDGTEISTVYSFINKWDDGYNPKSVLSDGKLLYNLGISEIFAIYPSCDSLKVELTSRIVPECIGEGYAIASGGIPPYSFNWNTEPVQFTQKAIGLTLGKKYDVSVTDNFGCRSSDSKETILSAISMSTEIKDVTCPKGSDGQVIITVTGNGKTPYKYSWNSKPAQSENITSNLSAGEYIITVKDSNECSAAKSITINQPVPIALEIESTTVTNCSGSGTGSASISAMGGTPPYTYLWHLTSGNISNQSVTGLSAGKYMATVTDFKQCKQDTLVVINAQSVANTEVILSNLAAIDKSIVSPLFSIYYNFDLPQTIKTNSINPRNLADPGKPVRFKIQAANNKANGQSIVSGSTKVLSSSPYAIITDSLSALNNIGWGAKAWSADEFEMLIDPNTPPGTSIYVDFSVIENNKVYTTTCIPIPVNPLIYSSTTEITIDDDDNPDSQGNNNDLAEAGETIEFYPWLDNISDLDADFVLGSLENLNNIGNVNIWNGKPGINDTVFNTTWWNFSFSTPSIIEKGETEMKPEYDFVFENNNNSLDSFDLHLVLSGGFNLFGNNSLSLVNWSLPYTFYSKPTSASFIPETVPTQDELKIFPNPARNILKFKVGSEPVTQIRIFNQSGMLMLVRESEHIGEIDVSNLLPGLYVLEYLHGNSRGHAKFIKQ